MSLTNKVKKRLQGLKNEYDLLKPGKESLLAMIDEAEIPENVYNSNAIENSTLTLKETEKILLEMEVARNVSLREVYEAKNLARVVEYIRAKAPKTELDLELILLLHQMLMNGIDDKIAGRLRGAGEYVRIGTYIAPSPEAVDDRIQQALETYRQTYEAHPVEKIARFHLEFESTHPFNDGNGRIGRVIVNYQLARYGFPAIIVRNKTKQHYYDTFPAYQDKEVTRPLEDILALALTESLHRRITHLRGDKIVKLASHAKTVKKSPATLLNAARRQTIPAFREKGTWKISQTYRP